MSTSPNISSQHIPYHYNIPIQSDRLNPPKISSSPPIPSDVIPYPYISVPQKFGYDCSQVFNSKSVSTEYSASACDCLVLGIISTNHSSCCIPIPVVRYFDTSEQIPRPRPLLPSQPLASHCITPSHSSTESNHAIFPNRHQKSPLTYLPRFKLPLPCLRHHAAC